jgi:hypothetical protein
MGARRTEGDTLSLFQAERYVPAARTEVVEADAARAGRASAELEAAGTIVRHLSSTLVPSDEICFALFEAPSAHEVRSLLVHAALPYEHIVEVVWIGPREP